MAKSKAWVKQRVAQGLCVSCPEVHPGPQQRCLNCRIKNLQHARSYRIRNGATPKHASACCELCLGTGHPYEECSLNPDYIYSRESVPELSHG